jgi:hypothetical protein
MILNSLKNLPTLQSTQTEGLMFPTNTQTGGETTPVYAPEATMANVGKGILTGVKALTSFVPRVLVSLAQLPQAIKTGQIQEGVNVPIWGKTESIQKNMSDVFTAYTEGKVPWYAVPLSIGSAYLDLSIVGGLAVGATDILARQATNAEVKTAWEFLGRPQSQEELSSTVGELQKVYHPDMPTGNAEMSKSINNAFNILKEKGIPEEGLIQKVGGIAQKFQTPVQELGKLSYTQTPSPLIKGLLTEQAGAEPIQPFQPFKPAPAIGLSTREVSEIKINQLED